MTEDLKKIYKNAILAGVCPEEDAFVVIFSPDLKGKHDRLRAAKAFEKATGESLKESGFWSIPVDGHEFFPYPVLKLPLRREYAVDKLNEANFCPEYQALKEVEQDRFAHFKDYQNSKITEAELKEQGYSTSPAPLLIERNSYDRMVNALEMQMQKHANEWQKTGKLVHEWENKLNSAKWGNEEKLKSDKKLAELYKPLQLVCYAPDHSMLLVFKAQDKKAMNAIIRARSDFYKVTPLHVAVPDGYCSYVIPATAAGKVPAPEFALFPELANKGLAQVQGAHGFDAPETQEKIEQALQRVKAGTPSTVLDASTVPPQKKPEKLAPQMKNFPLHYTRN